MRLRRGRAAAWLLAAALALFVGCGGEVVVGGLDGDSGDDGPPPELPPEVQPLEGCPEPVLVPRGKAWIGFILVKDPNGHFDLIAPPAIGSASSYRRCSLATHR